MTNTLDRYLGITADQIKEELSTLRDRHAFLSSIKGNKGMVCLFEEMVLDILRDERQKAADVQGLFW